MNNNPKLNGSGVKDPTAYRGIKDIVKNEEEVAEKACRVVKILKGIIRLAGFELIARIQIRHHETRKEFR